MRYRPPRGRGCTTRSRGLGGGDSRTENPRVGGSIPPLGTPRPLRDRGARGV